MREPVEVLSESEYQEMAQRAGIADAVACCDPCVNCIYKGLCDSGECAAICSELDNADPYDSGEDLYDF